MKSAALALRSVPRVALALPPVWRRRLTALLAVLIVLGSAYWLWFRDSSLARVQDVYVTGVDGPQARKIRSALEQAGLHMTTLHVRAGDLRSAVAEYPVVRSIAAEGTFPHSQEVVERIFAGVPEPEMQAIVGGNAARLYEVSIPS